MTTVKRFIDRLGTQKSRSCQIRKNTLKDIERSTKPVETAKIHRVWVAYCMWNSHLFILFINPKATIQKRGENKSVFPKERNRQRAFYALILSPFRVLFGTFCKRQLLFELALTFVGQSSKFISNSHHKPQNPTTNTGDWMLKWCSAQQGILSSYTVDSS